MADPRIDKINILLVDTRIRYIFILLKGYISKPVNLSE